MKVPDNKTAKRYAMTLRFEFNAVDDVAARKAFERLAGEQIGWDALGGAEIKLQEVYESRPPRQVKVV